MSSQNIRVRAKMRCDMNREVDGHEGRQVRLQAVYDPDGGPNASWTKWTPSGQVELHITNPTAYERFVVGKSYYVDFADADE